MAICAIILFPVFGNKKKSQAFIIERGRNVTEGLVYVLHNLEFYSLDP